MTNRSQELITDQRAHSYVEYWLWIQLVLYISGRNHNLFHLCLVRNRYVFWNLDCIAFYSTCNIYVTYWNRRDKFECLRIHSFKSFCMWKAFSLKENQLTIRIRMVNRSKIWDINKTRNYLVNTQYKDFAQGVKTNEHKS